MNTYDHVLISLEERHAINIFAGTKRVELRRRTMNVAEGTVVWIYVKRPIGSVVGLAIVAATHTLTPSQIWRRFGTCSGLEKTEFFNYFDGRDQAFALELKSVQKLKQEVPLGKLRDVSSGFHPPQFFTRIDPTGALANAMVAGVPKNALI
ncbi:transcriptional regulator [Paraburkholderia sp. Ac-20347]|uniref:transcriptional regulator n=1 Tax=Paraburkholderia sp. Ac-20347 TaxID=2703892 RepID=UPI0019826F03|nr:transcriptional regulator [Paraburkholderia sp. Ac-20347]MBN3814064.1 transcriptional regulator [Paraburkholderia sp. Ac-20347]